MPRRNNRIEEEIIDLLREHKEGLTITGISKKLNIHRHTVRKYVNLLVSQKKINQRNIGSAKLFYTNSDILPKKEISTNEITFPKIKVPAFNIKKYKLYILPVLVVISIFLFLSVFPPARFTGLFISKPLQTANFTPINEIPSLLQAENLEKGKDIPLSFSPSLPPNSEIKSAVLVVEGYSKKKTNLLIKRENKTICESPFPKEKEEVECDVSSFINLNSTFFGE